MSADLSALRHTAPALPRIMAGVARDRWAGREPVLAGRILRARPVMGVPLGGLGGGTITRGWRGPMAFARQR